MDPLRAVHLCFMFQGQYAFPTQPTFQPNQAMLLYPIKVPLRPQIPSHSPSRSEIQLGEKKRNAALAKKRKQVKPSHSAEKGSENAIKRTLSEKDELTLIHYCSENYSRYARINKKTYTKQAAKHLNLTYVPKEADKTSFTDAQVDYQLKFWMQKYKRVLKRFQDSGFGVQEGDPHTILEVAEQKMKHFHVFHAFLSTRANINPPAILQTRRDHGSTELHCDQTYGQINTGDDENLLDTGELSDEEDVLMETDDILPSSSGNAARSARPRKRKTMERGGGDSVVKRKRTGAYVVDEHPKQSNPGGESSGAQKQGVQLEGQGETTARNSSSRLKIVDDMYTSQAVQNEAQTQAYAKTVAVMEKESQFREEEVSIMKKNTGFREKEIEYLQRSQARLDREVAIKEEDEKRKKISMRRKVVMEQADQLRQQAGMYKSLNQIDKAMSCLEKMEDLMLSLGSIDSAGEYGLR